ncbi:MAG: hypothetical protein ACE14Q_02195 [Acidobacteriota bacterium]|nr:hypothetical protein [Thermoanaerobaculaceae bacterium]
MAKKLTSKEYDAMAQRLERMADGIKRHKGEAGFPARLDEKQRLEMRKRLEDLREEWEALVNKASEAYKEYFGFYTRCGKELAQDDDSLRGFYGKTNLVLRDFGTKVISTPSGRAKKKEKK